jgi:amino acid transporter
MRLHRLTHRSLKALCALGAMAAILIVLAATASAKPADTGPATQSPPAPTIVKETVVAPSNGGPDTIGWVLIGVGAGAALLGAGYLGARIATRTNNLRVS